MSKIAKNKKKRGGTVDKQDEKDFTIYQAIVEEYNSKLIKKKRK